jgi:multiple sugar transport system substrate-binding protein
VLYYKGIPEEGMIKDELRQFQNDSTISVDFRPIEYDDLWARLNDSFAKDDHSIDVAFVDDIWLRQFAEENRLVALDKLAGRDINNFTGDYEPTILDAEAYWPSPRFAGSSGKPALWCVPHRADVQVLLYNKKIFADPQIGEVFKKKTGRPLTVPDTWEEYVNVARGLNGIRSRGTPIVGCAETLRAGHYAFEFFACRYWSISNQDFFDEADVPRFASHYGSMAIQHFRDLKKAQCWAEDSLSAGHEETIEAFSSGNVALCPQWYTFCGHPKLKPMGDTVGVSLLPGTRHGNSHILRCPSIGGGSLGILAKADKQAAAWAFVRYFTGKEFCRRSAKLGAVVARKSPYYDQDVRSAMRDVDAYLNSLKIAKLRPRVRRFRDVETEIGRAVAEAINVDDARVLPTLEAAANRIRVMLKGAH